MEDILDLYEQPYDALRPVVSVDEKPVQLLLEVNEPLPSRPGQPERYDYEYRRNGTANIFGVLEPLTGRREMVVTEQRTAADFARLLKRIVDEWYPMAEVVRLVLDNLSTHSLASLYQVFEPEEARRIARKLEWHFTPVHGSWLNVIETEFSALGRQCLSRRIGEFETLETEVRAWTEARKARGVKVDWQFRTEGARVKLKHLYPKL